MNRRLYLPTIIASVVLIHFFLPHVGDAELIQIDHTHSGRAYGSPCSIDIARQISVDDKGFLYIAGTTKPRNDMQDPWGDTEAGELTGKTDIFVAKLSQEGELQWVRRTGSEEDETLGGMVIVKDGIYICGSTYGNYGSPVNGSADIYVVKFMTDGKLAWRRPFQFGSEGEDFCFAITVGNAIYVTGSTSGILFGSTEPPERIVHQFVARLDERGGDTSSLHLVRGRQRSGHSSGAVDNAKIAHDNLYYLSVNWNATASSVERVTSYLNIADLDTVLMQQLRVLHIDGTNSFRAMDMDVANETGNVYVIGIGTLENNREGYFALRLGTVSTSANSSIEWSSFLGYRSREVPLDLQQPRIIADEASNHAFVMGTEEGLFIREQSQSGIVLTPFLKLAADTGVVVEKWHRSVDIGASKQEILDMVMNTNGEIFYTGVWNKRKFPGPYALVGSVGSPKFVSMPDDSDPVTGSTELETNFRTGIVSPSRGQSIIGWLLIACLLIGIILNLLYFCTRTKQRSSHELFEGNDIGTAYKVENRASTRTIYRVTSEKSWHSKENAPRK